MSLQLAGKLTDVILARLDPNEDVLLGIRKVCREQNIRTGVIMSMTGALQQARLERFPANYKPDHSIPIEVIELEGPLEITAHGIIGETDAPEHGGRPFSVGGFVHGEPYIHCHVVATDKHGETICGHLVEGCLVRSRHPVSHFTVFIAKVSEAVLKLKCACGGVFVPLEQFPGRDRGTVYHDVVKE